MKDYVLGLATCCGLLVMLAGCGNVSVTKTSDPVQVTIKASSNGKPLNDVTLTLQPIEGGQQADIKIVKGEGAGAVVPGTYSYYVEKGKSEAEVEKIPENFRRGALDRKIEVNSTSNTFDLKLDK